MKIQVYRSFLTVAQCKSFTQAAEFLNFTQPTISNHIAALEETYGVTLFAREGKNVYLTAAEQAFVPEAQKILQEYEESIKFMSAFKEQSMYLRIAVSTQVINSYLLDILARLKTDFPELDILVDRRMTIEEILEKTVKEKYYDFAFVHMDVQPLYTKGYACGRKSSFGYAQKNCLKNTAAVWMFILILLSLILITGCIIMCCWKKLI